MTAPAARLIALGASNLTQGFLACLDVVRGATNGPVECLAALGRGRSYGLPTSLLGRGLPSITDCGLWPALAAASARASTALVMDVGNDILYGVQVPQILAWVDDVLTRLRPHAERRIVAGLPLHAVRALGPRRFGFVRTLLVPRSRLTFAQAQERTEQTDQGLRELAARHGATFAPLDGAWYGLDPVHFRRGQRRDAFTQLLAIAAAPPAVRLDTWRNRQLWLLARQERWTRFGRPQHTPQPVRAWADGSRVTLY